MLRRDMERYVALQRASGFVFDEQARVLESYVTFAASAGDIFVRTARVLVWSSRAASAQRRRTLLLTVRRFALALTAEDPRHEVPSSDLLPRAKRARQQPYIYSAAEIDALVTRRGSSDTRLPSGRALPDAVRPSCCDRHADIRGAGPRHGRRHGG